MAARGTEAKAQVIKKIIETFGPNVAKEIDKKIYITTKENGETIQVCLSLTCPKTLVGLEDAPVAAPAKSAFSGGFDFESMPAIDEALKPFTPAEITPDERQNVLDLMKKLGL